MTAAGPGDPGDPHPGPGGAMAGMGVMPAAQPGHTDGGCGQRGCVLIWLRWSATCGMQKRPWDPRWLGTIPKKRMPSPSAGLSPCPPQRMPRRGREGTASPYGSIPNAFP